MKFMKLGNRPDIFFTIEATRSVSTEVSTDLQIQVHKSLYRLHKFPLLSKCLRLQKLCSDLSQVSESSVIRLPDFPVGAEAFELCAKFCYGITITLSAHNIVPAWCAAHYLQMSDDADRGNLVGKLDVFFKSCILRRWKDTLVTLQSTRKHSPLCEELGITGRCVDAVATAIIAHPLRGSEESSGWWAEDVGELGIDHFWRIMVAVKSAGIVSNKLIGDTVWIYACRWLPNISPVSASAAAAAAEDSVAEPRARTETAVKQRMLMEKIVSLLPSEKGSVSCGFLLMLLKAANVLNASSSAKKELARRIGWQLEEAAVDDLLIPPASGSIATLYDVDLVATILEGFLLQGQSPGTSPPRERLLTCERRRSRSAENVEFEGLEKSRRSSSASHGSKLRVAKLIDGYLQEIARDENLPVEKLVAIAEAVPDFARVDHGDLYRVIDIYLRSHPELDKDARKRLCRILDCKKLSVEACMHAAQNEVLPLRVVVRVLFFEQSRAALTGGGGSSGAVAELPGNNKALLAKTASAEGDREALKLHRIGGGGVATQLMEEKWSAPRLRCPTAKLATLKMKLAEDDDMDEELISRDVLWRSASSRFRALCSLPKKPKRIIGRLMLAMNRRASERNRIDDSKKVEGAN